MTGALGQSSFKDLDYGVPVLVNGCIDDVVDVAFPWRGVAEAAKASRVWNIRVLESLVTVSGNYYICVFRWGGDFGIWAGGWRG